MNVGSSPTRRQEFHPPITRRPAVRQPQPAGNEVPRAPRRSGSSPPWWPGPSRSMKPPGRERQPSPSAKPLRGAPVHRCRRL